MMEEDKELNIDTEMEELIEIHEEAMERYNICKEAWGNIYTQYTNDTKFAAGDQWDPKALKDRRNNNRSALVYNKIPANIKFITSNARSCTPSIKVHPISEGATKNTAKVLDGLIKHIEYKSNAKSAYVKALECSVTGGFGVFRVVVEDSELDGKPDITIKQIKDPTNFFIDPNAENENFSDASYCFLFKWLPKKQFEELYPNKESCSVDNSNKEWFEKDMVQVTEYWVKKEGKVNFYLLSGEEILEKNENYPGRFLPFCVVSGTEIYVDGNRVFKGIVRDIIDQQKMLNYSKSETADYITKSSKQKWLVDEEHISDYQEIWDSANIDSYNYLPYKTGKDGSRPTKIDPDVPPTGFMATSKEADEDIRATIGIRDPLQDVPSSQSGKAIQLQISQGNLGTFEYLDKLNNAIRWCGVILVDLIPHFYNYPHIREIMGLDDNITPTPIGELYEDNGELVIHDLQKGYYSVTINVGPSYESQRTEAADKLVELVDKYPNMMGVAGDLIVKNLDFSGAEELAERLRATIDPNILAASNNSNGDKNQALQVLQSQMMQMSQQIQMMNEQNMQLQQLLSQAQQVINDKEADRQFEMNKKMIELENQRILKQMEIQYKKEELSTTILINEKSKKDELEHNITMEDVRTDNNVEEYLAKKEIDQSMEGVTIVGLM